MVQTSTVPGNAGPVTVARYRNLVVPLDGSRTSERAVAMAQQVALAAGAHVVLTHATAGPEGDGHGAGATDLADRAGVAAYLDAWVHRLGEAGVTARAELVAAAPADGIAAVVASASAGLVVMCTHGRSGPGRWIFGSVTEAVLARVTVPLLLIRRTGPVALPEDRHPGGLIVPLDGSRRAEAVLPHAVALGLAMGGPVRLLRVIAPELPLLPNTASSGRSAESDGAVEASAARYLAEVARRLEPSGVRVREAVRWSASPAEAILEEQRATGVTLVAMTTHGQSGLQRLLCGNTAWEVLQRGTTPLLLVRPPVG